MPLNDNQRINYVMRVITEYTKDNNVDPIGYRFEILYVDALVLTDGVLYSTFDLCVESLYSYLLKLYEHKPLQPFVASL